MDILPGAGSHEQSVPALDCRPDFAPALAVAALGWGLVRKPQLDSSSSELAVTLTTAILRSGSTDRLLAIAHPTLRSPAFDLAG